MRTKASKRMLIALFVLYVLAMAYLLFLQRSRIVIYSDYWDNVKANINLCPFETVRQLAGILSMSESQYLIRFAFINIAGNIVMFLPLGIFLPSLWKAQRKFWVFLLTVLGTILLIEVIQTLTLLGIGDVDDVILNSIGALLGFGIWQFRPVNRFLG